MNNTAFNLENRAVAMPTLTLKDIKNLNGDVTTFTLNGPKEETIDGEGKLTAMPAFIDPNVHFRVPGQSYKEDFMTGARAALAGGVTRVFDMPDNEPQIINGERLKKKKALIEEQLKESGIPLRYNLFFGANEKTIEEIPRVKDDIIGIKLVLGNSNGNMAFDNDIALERLFQIAADEQLLIAVHAEDQRMISVNQDLYKTSIDVRTHSIIQSRDAAVRATQKALYLASESNAEVYFCNVSTKEEVNLIRDAKFSGQLAWMEIAPHHLFLNEDAYDIWGSKVQCDPPLRQREDQWALWEAIIDGTADTIGSAHTPQSLQEKGRSYPQSPSGIPGIETRIPLLLNAYSEGKLSLERIIALCKTNIENIFQVSPSEDWVLVDLDLIKEVQDANLKTKCKWSPYAGRMLKGWPVYTILKGEAFRV